MYLPAIVHSNKKRLCDLLKLGSSIAFRFHADKIDDIKVALPDEPTACCMSGCANCTWIEYAEKLRKLLEGKSEEEREQLLNRIENASLRTFLRMELKSK